MARTCTQIIAAALAVCAPLVVSVAKAQQEQEVNYAAKLFYANFDEDVLLFAGGGVEEICNGASPPIVTAYVSERSDGTRVLRSESHDVPFVLYYTDLPPIEFIGQTCQAMFDGDPATVPVQPFASGTGFVRLRYVAHTDGVVDITNSIVGQATGPDGRSWLARGWADFAEDNGVLIGDPAEFQGLSIEEIKR